MLNEPGNANPVSVLTNMSYLISDPFAEAYLYCHLTAVDGYTYYLAEAEKYASNLDWFQAFLQNLIGNLITV
jgi:hypothetical protein